MPARINTKSKANATSMVIVIADAELSSSETNWSTFNREGVNRDGGQASAIDKSAIGIAQNYRSVCRSPVDKPARMPHGLMAPMDPHHSSSVSGSVQVSPRLRCGASGRATVRGTVHGPTRPRSRVRRGAIIRTGGAAELDDVAWQI